ncbi:MAG: hypothetical protein ACOYNO_03105 [Saprospiraceae bacterium]
MNYFSLRFDPEAMGIYPQAVGITEIYDIRMPNSFQNAATNNLLQQLLIPSKIHIKHNSKWTDRLSIGSISHPYLIISAKMLSVIQSVRTPNYYLYPVSVTKGQKTREYYIFVMEDQFIHYINLQTCMATLIQKSSPDVTPVDLIQATFTSHEDFLTQKSSLNPYSYFRITHFEMNPSAIEYDVFRLAQEVSAPASYFVSENFVTAADKANLTGIKFEPFPQEINSLYNLVEY